MMALSTQMERPVCQYFSLACWPMSNSNASHLYSGFHFSSEKKTFDNGHKNSALLGQASLGMAKRICTGPISARLIPLGLGARSIKWIKVFL